MKKIIFLILCLLLCCGWKVRTIGATYYVNASTGNDSNNGRTAATAWKTIGKINSTTLVAGTATINLQGSFSDACLSIGPNNAPVSSLVIQPYGSGYTITANCSGTNSAAVAINSISNVTIKNGTIVGNSGVTPIGILIENLVGGSFMHNITVTNMTIGGFYCGTGVAPCSTGTLLDGFGSEVMVRRFLDSDGAIDNVKITNNTLGGSSASSSDDNGVVVNNHSNAQTLPVPGGGIPFTQSNLTNVAIDSNIIQFLGGRSGVGGGVTGNGILINSGGSGEIKGNVIHDNGGNLNQCGGSAAVVLAVYAFSYTISYNSVYNQQPISFTAGCDWDAYDLDVGAQNTIVEYNYAYNVYGVCLFASIGFGNVFRYNICEKAGLGPSPTNLSIWLSHNFVTTVDFYNNTLYANAGSTVAALDDPGTTTGLFANNILYATSGRVLFHSLTVTGFTVINNDYLGGGGFSVSWNGTTYFSMATWQAAGGDASGITTNPSLTNPGNAGACTTTSIPNTCPAAYKLQVGSAMIGTGLNLTTGPYNRVIGTTDFYGDTIPNGVGTGYNFGADGGNP